MLFKANHICHDYLSVVLALGCKENEERVFKCAVGGLVTCNVPRNCQKCPQGIAKIIIYFCPIMWMPLAEIILQNILVEIYRFPQASRVFSELT